MRQDLALAAVLLFALSCSGSTAVDVGPTPSPVPTAAAGAELDISSFHVVVQPEGHGRILASFSLVETGGRSGATLEWLLFSTADGPSDEVDDWCWGDSPFRIPPNGSLDASALDYCQPAILTTAPGALATLTVGYRGDNGEHATAVASATIGSMARSARKQ